MTHLKAATTRRAALVGCATLGALATTTATQAVARPARSRRERKPSATFVLVHGAWHGAWCWRRVADRLQARGQRVYTPTLTGLADRSHLLSKEVTLATHASDVANLVKWEGLERIVLVGHSYAGFVITEVAERIAPSIASIVYLDAFYPQAGDSLLSLTPPGPRKALEAFIESGAAGVPAIPARVFKVNDRDAAWVDKMCTQQPATTLTDKTTAATARESIAKRTYIRAAAYPNPAFDAALAKTTATPGWRTFQLNCGHDAMIDLPDRLAAILMDVA